MLFHYMRKGCLKRNEHINSGRMKTEETMSYTLVDYTSKFIDHSPIKIRVSADDGTDLRVSGEATSEENLMPQKQFTESFDDLDLKQDKPTKFRSFDA